MLRFFFSWLIILILYFIPSGRTTASPGEGKLWLGINTQKGVCPEANWLWSLNSQVRLSTQQRAFQSVYVEPLLGYKLNENRVWLGYRLTNRPRFTEHRLIQQIVFPLNNNESKLSFRFRLEERVRSNQTQCHIRFRPRLTIEFPISLFCSNTKPYVSNELFVSFNKTTYTSHQFVNQNRLSLGINYYIHKSAWWEVGYVLQYLVRPNNNFYQFNHILSVNYNIR